MEYTSLKNYVITENLKDTAKTFYHPANVIGREILSSYDLVMDHFKNCHSHATAAMAAVPVIYENQDESDIYFNYNVSASASSSSAAAVSSINNQFSGNFIFIILRIPYISVNVREGGGVRWYMEGT